MLTAEVSLNLVENSLALSLGGGEFAELEGLARAPEETTFGELGVAVAVHANSKVVVGLET